MAVDEDASDLRDEYVLYVAQDARDPSRFCAGSRQALRVVDTGGLQERVSVQSVDALLRSTDLPAWLTGTPTLVSRASRQAIRGARAIEHLEGMVRQAEEAAANVQPPEDAGVQGLTLASESAHLAPDANFELGQPDDPKKYEDSKLTEDAVKRFIERRQASVAPP